MALNELQWTASGLPRGQPASQKTPQLELFYLKPLVKFTKAESTTLKKKLAEIIIERDDNSVLQRSAAAACLDNMGKGRSPQTATKAQVYKAKYEARRIQDLGGGEKGRKVRCHEMPMNPPHPC